MGHGESDWRALLVRYAVWSSLGAAARGFAARATLQKSGDQDSLSTRLASAARLARTLDDSEAELRAPVGWLDNK